MTPAPTRSPSDMSSPTRGAAAQRGPHPGSQATRSRLVWDGMLLTALVVAVLATHWPVLRAQAVAFDDMEYVVDNPQVQNPSWRTAGRFLREVLAPTGVRGYYQPLTLISLMLDFALGGRPDEFSAFHRTNLALHAANSVLVAVLFWQLFRRGTAQGSERDTSTPAPSAPLWPAMLVALLFGVHPLTVEPVAWVVERKTLLATFLSLVSVNLYFSHLQRASRVRYVAAVVLFAAGLMAKPTTVMLPLVLIVLEYWPLGLRGRRLLVNKVPFFMVAGVSAVITYVSQSRTLQTIGPGEYGPGRIPLLICHSLIFYLIKFVWPASLSAHYPFPAPFTLADPGVLRGVVGTCVLIPALVLSLRWTPALLTGFVVFLLAVFPTLGIIGFTQVIAADKYVYLPMLGLFLPLAAALYHLAQRAAATGAQRVVPAASAAGLLALALLSAAVARRQIHYWQDTETLYRHMLALAPQSASLHNNYGMYLRDQDRLEEASVHLARAVELLPGHGVARGNLGEVLLQLGRLEEAVVQLRQAVAQRPHDIFARVNLGLALLRLGRWTEARSELEQVLRQDPSSVAAHDYLAQGFRARGMVADAVRHYQAVLRIDPGFYEARLELASLYASAGQPEEALRELRAAVAVAPGRCEARIQLGDLLAARGAVAEALEQYRAAIQADPRCAEARQRLERLGQPGGVPPP